MEMINNEVIVIGGNHYNTLCVARGLGIKGYNVVVIVYDDVIKSFVSKSKYVTRTYYVSSSSSLLPLLFKDLRAKKRTVLISASDNAAEFIDMHYEQLRNLYYIANCNNERGRIAYWMKKRHMLEAAKKVGFNYIPTIVVDLENIDENLFINMSFPCLLKPEMSSHGKKTDFRLCDNYDSLQTAMLELKASCRYILVQKYIKPDYEINLIGVRYDNKCILPGLVRKIKTCSSSHNMGMMTVSCLTDRLDEYVNRKMVKDFLKEIGYNGIFSMEFIMLKGSPYFLEINMRTDGTMYMHTEAGVNFPQIWADFNYKGESEGPFQYSKTNVYGMTEISYIKYIDWKHPIEVIKDWWRTDCYSIFSWSDIKPFIYKFIYELF